ncbi:GTP-binding protein [Deinococcus piscis]|uniref:GTP-binding protein n=1 Tax=Deinococcus piscis TaxID=394230 RepID=A0ABQ3K7P7_9DEIO|nr:GTP-binding protein [Deinococcus piscis]GHG04509.1 GTP-binding protein [Deinococcus piscis]
MKIASSTSVPVTVLCGFLGAGKTTLLNHLLTQSGGRKVAVIVNEFGAVNIDASLVVKTDEKTIELSNGCICCTLRGDLLEAVDSLLRERELDHILIESTGIGEPLPIAQGFCLTPDDLALEPGVPDLTGRVHVDAMITVVDCAQFFDLWNSEAEIEGDGESADEVGRSLSELLAEQLEFADIAVLNKVDLAAEADVERLRELLAVTNPRARVLTAVRGQVPLSEVLDTGLFDLEASMNLANWAEELEKEHVPESEEFGLETLVYRRSRPFDRQRLINLLERGLPRSILRSKGWADFGGGEATLWNHTGRTMALEQLGPWLEPELASTELVFIGQQIDRAALEQMLDSALAEQSPT